MEFKKKNLKRIMGHTFGIKIYVVRKYGRIMLIN